MNLSEKHNLSTKELLILRSELNNNAKSLAIAYIMLLGGHLGAHRFYFKRYATGIVQLILFLAAIGIYIISTIVLTLQGVNEDLAELWGILLALIPGSILTVWIIIDIFLISKWTKAWNDALEKQLMDEIAAMREK